MKRGLYSYVAFVAILLVAGCDSNIVEIPEVKSSILVSHETFDNKTIIGELESDKTRKIYWNNGDDLVVNSVVSQPLTGIGERCSKAEFWFRGLLSLPYNIVYPASIYKNETTITLPYIRQSGTAESLNAPMYGYADDLSSITLKHLCAILKFTIYGKIYDDHNTDHAIYYVMVRTPDSKQLSGDFAIDYKQGTLRGLSSTTNNTKAIVMVNEKSSVEEAIEVYVVVPAGVYESGFSLWIVDEKNHAMKKSAKAQELKAGEIKAMPPIEFEPTDTVADSEI